VIKDDRLGIVRLSLPDGRTFPLRFTWTRIDAVGREWIVEKFAAIIAGKAGCQAAMAELLVLASGGAIETSELLTDDGDTLVGFEAAFEALNDAWLIARFGPSRKAPGQPGNPPKRRPTRLRRFFERLFNFG
jgi:hypothetical protein